MEALPIVLDNGSYSIKAGFAGEAKPRVELPNWDYGHDEKESRRRPVMMHGVVDRWDALIENWREVFQMLEAGPGNSGAGKHPVLITEAPLNPKVHREKLVTHLFEDFGVPAVQFVHSGSLALYATGSRTGLVIDVGDTVAQTVPIWESYIVPPAVGRRDVGGRDLTDYLKQILSKEHGFSASSSDEDERIWQMKEEVCQVAPSSEGCPEELPGRQSFTLPDGKTVNLAQAHFHRCPEALFRPTLVGQEEDLGIHRLALQSIEKSGLDTQRNLASNIVLSGGSMMFPGMQERVMKELRDSLPSSIPVKATLVSQPRHAAFVGGAIVASLSDLQKSFVTRAEFDEFGSAIINKKTLSLTAPTMS
eukprot:TRINITY_DN32659_c0_g1_i1.p1 TRINITY_DN32659_c0_g1~~TRINITY_DN32659_c0_g1_i1.p1  ORF type:complete len:363 (+),score=74.87 TRINITY_DN32659_c0_g1_i1:76-1164(+)